MTGNTWSSNFPTQDPYQGTCQDCCQYWGDAFVTKLSSSGSSLIYSTYLGGGDEDEANGIAVDGSGNAYVAGRTFSSDFPTLNPFQSTYNPGNDDAFVTKLSSSGNSLVYSTFLGGGDGPDLGYGIAVDGNGNAYVTGLTASWDFPVQNPYQTHSEGTYYYDAFVTKLSSSGNSLIYSTFLGGEGEDIGYGITVDGGGNAYVTGETRSSSFPTLNPYQATYQSGDYPLAGDVFVTKLSNSGNSLIYSTYLGGGATDFGYGIAVDGSGNAYVTGKTWSSNFPTQNPYQRTYQDGGSDGFVTKLSEMEYSYGDVNRDAIVDISDAVYLTAYIFSGGSAPSPLVAGDANCDGTVDISDMVYLIAYVFSGGLAPGAGCK